MITAMRRFHRAVGLSKSLADPVAIAGKIRQLAPDRQNDPGAEAGMATAEYAIGTLAAAAFAGILLAIMKSGSLQGILQSLIESALSVG